MTTKTLSLQQVRFMRLILFFDLPQKTKEDKYNYQKFSKNLKEFGFIRVQYSVYSRLCIDRNVASSLMKNIKLVSPINADIRYLIVTEKTYQSMVDLNNSTTLQEKIINKDRLFIFRSKHDH